MDGCVSLSILRLRIQLIYFYSTMKRQTRRRNLPMFLFHQSVQWKTVTIESSVSIGSYVSCSRNSKILFAPMVPNQGWSLGKRLIFAYTSSHNERDRSAERTHKRMAGR